MQINRLPLNAMRTFVVAAKHLNINHAAAELYVTHSAVSHQIKTLEESLNQKLFDRRKRPLRLTPAGEELRTVLSECLEKIQHSVNTIEFGSISGEVTLSCVPGLAANWLVPKLGGFLEEHENIVVKLTTDYWNLRGRPNDADLAITYGSAEAPGKRVLRLGQSDYFPVCTPSFLEKVGPILVPEDIAKHTLLHEYNDVTWSRWFASVGLANTKAVREVYFDGAHLSLSAARSGYGIALGDMPTVIDDLKSGRLVQLFKTNIPATFPYYLIAEPKLIQSSAAAKMEEWLLSNYLP